MSSSRRPVLVLDFDEVIFPFAESYASWRRICGLKSFDPAVMLRYDFADALGDPAGDDADTTAFLEDPVTLYVPPLRGAVEGLQLLATMFDLVVVTYRYESSQAEATRAWISRWLPNLFVSELFSRSSSAGPSVEKSVVCASLGAVALVDDNADHFVGLSDCQPFLFGVYPWQHTISQGVVRVPSWVELPAAVIPFSNPVR